MINYIWGFMVIISSVCAVATGRIPELSDAILKSSSQSIELVISMCGMMCFWTGLMKIADTGGITHILARILRPIIKVLFPEYDDTSPAIRAICLNLTANILGLGNAATPMGIAAMKELTRCNKNPHTASNSMVMFVVMNTASLQLIPTMMSILRQSHGSVSPFEVMPAIWISSLVALVMGIASVKLLERRDNTWIK